MFLNLIESSHLLGKWLLCQTRSYPDRPSRWPGEFALESKIQNHNLHCGLRPVSGSIKRPISHSGYRLEFVRVIDGQALGFSSKDYSSKFIRRGSDSLELTFQNKLFNDRNSFVILNLQMIQVGAIRAVATAESRLWIQSLS